MENRNHPQRGDRRDDNLSLFLLRADMSGGRDASRSCILYDVCSTPEMRRYLDTLTPKDHLLYAVHNVSDPQVDDVIASIDCIRELEEETMSSLCRRVRRCVENVLKRRQSVVCELQDLVDGILVPDCKTDVPWPEVSPQSFVVKESLPWWYAEIVCDNINNCTFGAFDREAIMRAVKDRAKALLSDMWPSF